MVEEEGRGILRALTMPMLLEWGWLKPPRGRSYEDSLCVGECVICHREAVCWQRMEMEEPDEVLVRPDVSCLAD